MTQACPFNPGSIYWAMKLESPTILEILTDPALLLVTLMYSPDSVSVDAPVMVFIGSISMTGSEPEQEANMVGLI